MMILAFFGDNHQIQSQVVHYLDQTIKGFVIDHIDNDSKRLSVEQKIGGISCNGRGTSCGDQLAKACREAYEAEQK